MIFMILHDFCIEIFIFYRVVDCTFKMKEVLEQTKECSASKGMGSMQPNGNRLPHIITILMKSQPRLYAILWLIFYVGVITISQNWNVLLGVILYVSFCNIIKCLLI